MENLLFLGVPILKHIRVFNISRTGTRLICDMQVISTLINIVFAFNIATRIWVSENYSCPSHSLIFDIGGFVTFERNSSVPYYAINQWLVVTFGLFQSCHVIIFKKLFLR